MIALRPGTRRALAWGARTSALLCAGVVVLSTWTLVVGDPPRASAAATAGVAELRGAGQGELLDAGGSDTVFSLGPKGGISCPGDTANAGWRIQTYMVKASVDPASLTWDSTGPIPNDVGSNFSQPLYISPGQVPFVDMGTALADTPGGPGPIVLSQNFDLTPYAPSDLPAGDYNVGFACTKGTASATQLGKFWNIKMTVTANNADTGPAKIHWTVATQAETTTTSTTPGQTTTSTPSGSTSTTIAGSTTSTTTSGSTTTTTTDTSSTTTTATDGSTTTAPGDPSTTTLDPGSGDSSGTDGTGSSTLSRTGRNLALPLVASFLFLVLGRMAVLLGREPADDGSSWLGPPE